MDINIPNITGISNDILKGFQDALKGIPIVGSVVSVLNAIGISVKGKTQHVSSVLAEQVATKVTDPFMAQLQAGGSALVNAVGTEYPAWLASLIASGQYWGGMNSISAGYIMNDLQQYAKESDMMHRAGATFNHHALWVAMNVDADGFQENFTTAFLAQTGSFFAFIKSKYGVDASGAPLRDSAATNFVFPLLGIGILIAIVVAAKKKRK